MDYMGVIYIIGFVITWIVATFMLGDYDFFGNAQLGFMVAIVWPFTISAGLVALFVKFLYHIRNSL